MNILEDFSEVLHMKSAEKYTRTGIILSAPVNEIAVTHSWVVTKKFCHISEVNSSPRGLVLLSL